MPSKPRTVGRRAAVKTPRRLLSVALALAAILLAARAWRSVEPTNEASVVPGSPAVQAPVLYTYRIVNTYPHDPDAFTQGLLYRDGVLYESTGLNGRSSLRKVRLETGEVLQMQHVSDAHFAEGLTDWDDRLIQLTWRSGVGLLYDRVSFAKKGEFSYQGEGWGLTHDDKRLIMSDGSADLRFLDPTTLREAGRVTVTDRGAPIPNLNELEFVKGEVLANVWQTEEIVIVAPGTGRVTGRIDMRGLLQDVARSRSVDVLNGIAYDASRDRLFVTGKLWPKLFEIALEKK
jgi:glutaminyl-peptide cyclotransferase